MGNEEYLWYRRRPHDAENPAGVVPVNPDALMCMQRIQDLLSDRMGICLVLVDHNGSEATIPSRLPLECLDAGDYSARCRSEIRTF